MIYSRKYKKFTFPLASLPNLKAYLNAYHFLKATPADSIREFYNGFISPQSRVCILDPCWLNLVCKMLESLSCQYIKIGRLHMKISISYIS